MKKLIIFDMDGVIFEHTNFWFELHKRFNTYEEGLELTKKYLKTNYQKLVNEVVGRLWKNKPAKPLFDLIKEIKYVKGVKETFKLLHQKKYLTAIITSGDKKLAQRAKKELNIDYIFTNELIVEDNKIKGEFNWPIGDAKKQVILKQLCKDHHVDLKDCIVVVHDSNDIKMAKVAGKTIAFCPIDEEIKKYSNRIINEKDLREILNYIE